MTKAQTAKKIAVLEHMYNAMTSKASLAEKAAIISKIRALEATV